MATKKTAKIELAPRSLLQEAADDCRDAHDTLDELKAEYAEAKNEWRVQLAAEQEAKRRVDIALAKLNAQKECCESYLQQMAQMAQAAQFEL